MAAKFKNRIDYVDIAAYGLSKVNLDTTRDDESVEVEESAEKFAERRLFEKIRGLEKRTDQLGYSLGGMAIRNDERTDLALQRAKPDVYQALLTRKIFGK